MDSNLIRLFKIPNFILAESFLRSNCKGGGVGIFVKETVHFIPLKVIQEFKVIHPRTPKGNLRDAPLEG